MNFEKTVKKNLKTVQKQFPEAQLIEARGVMVDNCVEENDECQQVETFIQANETLMMVLSNVEGERVKKQKLVNHINTEFPIEVKHKITLKKALKKMRDANATMPNSKIFKLNQSSLDPETEDIYTFGDSNNMPLVCVTAESGDVVTIPTV